MAHLRLSPTTFTVAARTFASLMLILNLKLLLAPVVESDCR
jgi:hypothetical protein